MSQGGKELLLVANVLGMLVFSIAFLARWWLTRKSISFRVYTGVWHDEDGTEWYSAQLEGQDGFSTSRHRDAAVAHELYRAAWLTKQAGDLSRGRS